MKRCVHSVAPRVGARCGAGVDIRSLSGGAEFGWVARLPCATSPLSRGGIACPLYREQTCDELDAEVAAMDAVTTGHSLCCLAAVAQPEPGVWVCTRCKTVVARECGSGWTETRSQ